MLSTEIAFRQSLPDYLHQLGLQSKVVDQTLAVLDEHGDDGSIRMTGSCVLKPTLSRMGGRVVPLTSLSQNPLWPMAAAGELLRYGAIGQNLVRNIGSPLHPYWSLVNINGMSDIFGANVDFRLGRNLQELVFRKTFNGVPVGRFDEKADYSQIQVQFVAPFKRGWEENSVRNIVQGVPGNLRQGLSRRQDASQAKVGKLRGGWEISVTVQNEQAMVGDDVLPTVEVESFPWELVRLARGLRVNATCPPLMGERYGFLQKAIENVDVAQRRLMTFVSGFESGRDSSLRLVDQVDGVFSGVKRAKFCLQHHVPIQLVSEVAMETLNAMRADSSVLELLRQRPEYLYPYLQTSLDLSSVCSNDWEQLAMELILPERFQEVAEYIGSFSGQYDIYCRQRGFFSDWKEPHRFLYLLTALYPFEVGYWENMGKEVMQLRQEFDRRVWGEWAGT